MMGHRKRVVRVETFQGLDIYVDENKAKELGMVVTEREATASESPVTVREGRAPVTQAGLKRLTLGKEE